MRGKDAAGAFWAAAPGITPAYAGKRRIRYRCQDKGRDHPRLCGEKFSSASQAAQKEGSPPPMRGKGYCTRRFEMRYRITPAYAGKRASELIVAKTLGDHPRLCGEKQFRAVPPDGYIGSPPPMRGKEINTGNYDSFHRITPAYAGKSTSTTYTALNFEDHPRLCGEKKRSASATIVSPGSPPPMRGKAISVFYAPVGLGITPAYAGKSRRHCQIKILCQDHPRLCGEKSRYSVTLWITAGSPPPMRGKGKR